MPPQETPQETPDESTHETQHESPHEAAESSDLIRAAIAAFQSGDLATLCELLHEDFEWDFYDLTHEPPVPATCRGPRQIIDRAGRANKRRTGSRIEEVLDFGEKYVVVSHFEEEEDPAQPGARGDQYHVVTLRDGRVARLRACLTREEALSAAAPSAE